MDADPFPLRGEGSQCSQYPGATDGGRIPKAVVLEVLRNAVSVVKPKDITAVPELSLDNWTAFVERNEGDGVFLYKNDKILEVFKFAIDGHCRGRPICVILNDSKLLGLPGTTLSVRRVLRTLFEIGENTTTSQEEVNGSLKAFAALCG